MCRRTLTILMLGGALVAVLGAGSSWVLAHGGGPMGSPGHGMGPLGMMGHMGSAGLLRMSRMMGAMGAGSIWMLDLSDEQRTTIHKIQDELRKAHWRVMGKVMDESSKLRDLYSEEEWDQKRIGAVYGTIFDLRRQLIEARIDAHNRIVAALTKQQREQLKNIRHGHYRRPGMMGPGMHGGMMGG